MFAASGGLIGGCGCGRPGIERSQLTRSVARPGALEASRASQAMLPGRDHRAVRWTRSCPRESLTSEANRCAAWCAQPGTSSTTESIVREVEDDRRRRRSPVRRQYRRERDVTIKRDGYVLGMAWKGRRPRCMSCLDSRSCWVCSGFGWIPVRGDNRQECSRCAGTGKCPDCAVPE